MHLDVLDLRDFYYRTQLGRAAQKAVRNRVLSLWPADADVLGASTVVGFGFAVPLLRPYLGVARRVIGLMPGQQGVMPWPAGQPNVSVLCEETRWPLETGMADRVVVMHGLETSDQPTALLNEAARVLGPGGRALLIVPNRAGLWAPREGTPFGCGRPYTLGQLDAQARAAGFVPERHSGALYIPPSGRRFWLRSSAMWEDLGARISGLLVAGVVILEVSKQVQMQRPSGLGAAVRRPLKILEGVGQGVPRPTGFTPDR
ncbi:methyltransferase domain-containing protein [Phaeovulum vinaykumarii]|uniref:Methyltransferase domain-containing protein n=1 Tax=Phaeovulum vinaykumarii TaxID=407234 RepID=A0A1N7MVJ9_9RHOB|nr:methyltransferase domain-containing protein [Phaeovulum vinaykumarii]SIS90038.1 Methyltransferase domain-containing protein [Phaeovulum vinaykumarii]SOC16839.1 methyltransferase family protein [Phaeovulum vinaykumarii]